MTDVTDLPSDEISRRLTYAGLVLVAFELLKGMIVDPIKQFYANTTFSAGLPFKTYDEDVRSRAPHEFEACLLYLKDFMQAIDSSDIATIDEMRRHRNDVAHNLPQLLPSLQIDKALWTRTDRTLFKLSNYRFRMEFMAEAEFRQIEVNWETAKGHDYWIFERTVESIEQMLKVKVEDPKN